MRWMKRVSQSMKTTAQRFWQDRRGATGWFVGATMVPLVAAGGLSVDGARGYLVKARLSQALDAAALAGGRAMYSPNRDSDIMMYFNANFPPGMMNATINGPIISVDANEENITVSASATLPTTFMRILGFQDIPVAASAVVNRQNRGMELVLVMDNTGSMSGNNKIGAMRDAASDLIDILYGTRETIPNFWVGLVPYAAFVNIGAERAAWTTAPMTVARNVNTITRSSGTVTVTTSTNHGFESGDIVTIAGAAQADYNGKQYIRNVTANTFQFSVVGTPTTPATGTITATREVVYPAGSAWKGCVMARNEPLEEAQAETLPANTPWPRQFWQSTSGVTFVNQGVALTGNQDNHYPPVNETVAAGNNATGPNLGCPQAIQPLQPNKSVALAQIATMAPWSRGGTMANLGLAWAYRMLSPQWRGMWGGATPANLPLDFNTPLMDKVVVLLTDGVNEWYDWPGYAPGCSGISNCNIGTDADYTSYARLRAGRLGTTSNTTARTIINTRMTSLCTNMKQRGVIIYTILVQVNDAPTQDLYRNCATLPEYYFLAPQASDLAAIFRTIAVQLSNLRLSR